MSEQPQSLPFEVVPGPPTLVHVKDASGKEWRVALTPAVVAVRQVEAKDPKTGNTLFEIDLQVGMATTPRPTP